MPLSDIVNVVVTTQNPGVTAAGFGVPLIVSQNAGWVERTRVYTKASDVLADFAASTPEYNAASKIFAQSPAPTRIRIGRANTSPVTQRWSVAVVVAVLSSVYKVRLANAANTESLASYTAVAATAWQAATAYAQGQAVTNDSGKVYVCTTAGTSAGAGGPTGTGAAITDNTVTWMYAAASGTVVNDVIMYNLKLAIDALSFTPAVTTSLQGSAGTKTLRVLANASTSWFAVNLDDPNLLTVLQDHDAPAASSLAADLTAIADETTDFYGIVTLYNSELYIKDAAAWTETAKKLYIAATADTICATTSDSVGTDVIDDLEGLGYARTQGVFHPRAAQFMDAAEMGRFFPISPGGDNWRLKTLAGVSSGWGNGQQYTATQRTNLNDKKAAWYYDIAGVNVVGGEGTSASGAYIDVTRGVDWWTARVSERIANRLIQSDKVAFTDDGIAIIEAEVRAQNAEGIKAGLINPGSPPGIPAPTVTVPKAGDVSSADRAARTLNGVNTSWTLAGALNHIGVNVQVTA